MTTQLARRRVLQGATAATLATAAQLGFPTILKAADAVKVGLIIPLTGLETILGETLLNCYKLAANDLNSANGIAGRQVELVVEDSQTTTKGCIDKARKLIGADKVDVLAGGILSLERQAIVSVSEPAKRLYIYPTYYEGGECKKYLMCTGQVPNQQIDPYVPYIAENVGKTVYIISSDYVWPRVSTELITAAFNKAGGRVVAADFFPFGTQDFGPTFQKIRQAKPDMVWIMIVGNDLITAMKQYRSFDMPFPLVTQLLDEVVTMVMLPAGSTTGILSAQSYFMTIDSVENKKFVEAYQKAFGAGSVINAISEAAYCSLHLYAKAVEKVGTMENDKVIEAMGQVAFDAPEGRVNILAANNHMRANNIIGRVNEEGWFEIVRNFGQIDPDVPGCRLI